MSLSELTQKRSHHKCTVGYILLPLNSHDIRVSSLPSLHIKVGARSEKGPHNTLKLKLLNMLSSWWFIRNLKNLSLVYNNTWSLPTVCLRLIHTRCRALKTLLKQVLWIPFLSYVPVIYKSQLNFNWRHLPRNFPLNASTNEGLVIIDPKSVL